MTQPVFFENITYKPSTLDKVQTIMHCYLMDYCLTIFCDETDYLLSQATSFLTQVHDLLYEGRLICVSELQEKVRANLVIKKNGNCFISTEAPIDDEIVEDFLENLYNEDNERTCLSFINFISKSFDYVPFQFLVSKRTCSYINSIAIEFVEHLDQNKKYSFDELIGILEEIDFDGTLYDNIYLLEKITGTSDSDIKIRANAFNDIMSCIRGYFASIEVVDEALTKIFKEWAKMFSKNEGDLNLFRTDIDKKKLPNKKKIEKNYFDFEKKIKEKNDWCYEEIISKCKENIDISLELNDEALFLEYSKMYKRLISER